MGFLSLLQTADAYQARFMPLSAADESCKLLVHWLQCMTTLHQSRYNALSQCMNRTSNRNQPHDDDAYPQPVYQHGSTRPLCPHGAGHHLIWLRRPPRSSDGPVQRSKISIEQSGHLSVYVCRFPHQTITLNFAKLKGQLLERLKGTGHALAVDKANGD